MKTKKRKKTWFFYNFSRIFIGIALILSCLGMILTKDDSQRSRFAFTATQSLLFLVCLFIPRIIEKTAKIYISNILLIIFLIVCICHFILGEICEFYIHIKFWDSVLHTFTGVTLSILSFSILNLMNNNLKGIKLSPLFVAFFAVFFTLSIGVLWEIIEYTADGLFKTNMQRYMNSITLVPFEGREALKDTMKDLMLDAAGATVFAVIGYFALKHEKNIFKGFEITQKDDSIEKNENEVEITKASKKKKQKPDKQTKA